MTVIDRWTVEGLRSWGRTLINVAGPDIAPHAQRKLVREEDYDALADQLKGAVKAEREWCERILDVDQRDQGDGRLLAALANHATVRLRELGGQPLTRESMRLDEAEREMFEPDHPQGQ